MEHKNVCRVTMLGIFSLNYGGNNVPMRHYGTAKLMQLLQLLFLNGHEGIGKEELAAKLYEDSDQEAGAAALRVNVFRLRKYLEKLDLFENPDLVWFQGGRYRWNDRAVQVQLDVTDFEEACDNALALSGVWEEMKDRTGDEDEELRRRTAESLREAVYLYKGEFLPGLTDTWCVEKRIQLEDRFEELVTVAARILKKMGEASEILYLTEYASSVSERVIYPIMQIESLMENGRSKDALRVYEIAAAKYLNNSANRPSEEMLDRFNLLRDRIRFSSQVVTDIKSQLQEDQYHTGAYYCSYPGFVDCYRIMERYLERKGSSAYLILCTPRKSDEEMDDEKRVQVMDALKNCIGNSLRRGDSFTMYGNNKYLLLLPEIGFEDCSIVTSRIRGAFEKSGIRGKVSLEFDLYPVNEND